MSIVGKKIRLHLTDEQENYCRRAAGTSRWAYNSFLARNISQYEAWKTDNSLPKRISAYDYKKEITQLKKTSAYSWLKEIAAEVTGSSIIAAEKSFKSWWSGKSGRPKFKSQKNSILSFAIQKKNFQYTKNGCKIENLGFVRTAEPLPKQIKGSYLNPRVIYDNKYWYITFSCEEHDKREQLSGSIGIDLGIKTLAIVASDVGNHWSYPNINKTKEVRRLEILLKRYQQKFSRKVPSGKNSLKARIKIQRVYRRLTNIRNNYLHQVTTEIVKTKPSRIVLEDLNVSGMLKNHHLAKAIKDQKFYEFRTMISYKAKKFGIEVIFVPRFFPSSKMCCKCGSLKKDLKLSDRIYHCDCCGSVIDRDLNAAINLAKYQGNH